MTSQIPAKMYDNHCLILLFFMLLTYFTCYVISEVQCSDKERDALLHFKSGIRADHCGLLDSWEGNLDCCQWGGIHCNNYSGHVTMLRLPGNGYDEPCLEGTVSNSLAELKRLKYLDLSFNNFQTQTIPDFIGSLSSLENLNLSSAGFGGSIPKAIGNLSRLSSLDLSCFYVSCSIRVESLSWLSNLTLLRDIDLGGIDLTLATNWVSVINSLPFLEVLRMDSCSLPTELPSSLSYLNSSKTLHLISLSGNFLSDLSIFQWLYNLSRIETSLTYLDLSFNQFSEGIPSVFGKMNSLSHLDLSGNDFSGQIPSEIWTLDNLSYLSVADNRLEGPITNTDSNLRHLVSLDLSGNKLEIKKEALKSLAKSCRLKTLSLDGNNLTYDFSSVIQSLSSCAYKSLVSLTLSNTQISGSIPSSISKLSSLEQLDVSDNQLNGTIGEGIGQLSRLEELLLSHNFLNGVVSQNHFSNLSSLKFLNLSYNQALVLNLSANWTPPFQLIKLTLRSCKIGLDFPKWLLTQRKIISLDISDGGICDIVPISFWSIFSSTIKYLYMSNNMIYGVLPDLSITFQSLIVIDMSSNNLSGSIPTFLGNNVDELNLSNNRLSQGLFRFLCPKSEMKLRFLVLSNNLFSERLPDCWGYFPYLSVLQLENNNISGNLPSSIAAINNLQALHLRNNSLFGELPISWVNSTSLAVLDLSYNSFTGYIPPSFGQNLKHLQVLSLRNNRFSMGIPSSLCQLSHLQILDLSGNHISESLPKCLYNLDAMASTSNYPQYLEFDFDDTRLPSDIAWFMWKRKENSFDDSLGLLKGIDISSNNLQGPIPDEISSLVGLIFLNLSQNNLSGHIPSSIGQLTSLEFLDLSHNQISGEIPTSLASIASLEILDLSKNNLSGKIPLGTQLQGFDASSYTGNPGLCGAPLPNCAADQTTPIPQNRDNFPGSLMSVAIGFITGFCGVCGTLVLKRSWRLALFRFYDSITESM